MDNNTNRMQEFLFWEEREPSFIHKLRWDWEIKGLLREIVCAPLAQIGREYANLPLDQKSIAIAEDLILEQKNVDVVLVDYNQPP